MSNTTFATITVAYKLSPSTKEHLGDDALSLWDAALTAELERAYPDADVTVDTRWSNVDASSFDATCETAEGVEVVVSRNHSSAVSVGADPDALEVAAWEAIERRFADADQDAWGRACESVAV